MTFKNNTYHESSIISSSSIFAEKPYSCFYGPSLSSSLSKTPDLIYYACSSTTASLSSTSIFGTSLPFFCTTLLPSALFYF